MPDSKVIYNSMFDHKTGMSTIWSCETEMMLITIRVSHTFTYLLTLRGCFTGCLTVCVSFKVCIIGSREQLCIHPQVTKETNNTTKVYTFTISALTILHSVNDFNVRHQLRNNNNNTCVMADERPH